MTVRVETGTREAPVPDSQKKKAVLTDPQAAELAKLGAAMHHAPKTGDHVRVDGGRGTVEILNG